MYSGVLYNVLVHYILYTVLEKRTHTVMRKGRRDEEKRKTTANSVDEEIKHTMEMEARRKQGGNDQN